MWLLNSWKMIEGEECGYCQGMAGIAALLLCYGCGKLAATIHGVDPPRRAPISRKKSTTIEGIKQRTASMANLKDGKEKNMNGHALDGTLNGLHTLAQPPMTGSGKFQMHDMMRTGFPGLQSCFMEQEALTKLWMPKVHSILVRFVFYPIPLKALKL